MKQHEPRNKSVLEFETASIMQEMDSLNGQMHTTGVLGARLSGGLLHTPRLLRSPLIFHGQAFQIVPAPRGSLSNLATVPLQGLTPGQGQVVLAVQAVGLNFRDVLNVLGMYPGNPGQPGSDVAGIVTAIGPGAYHLHKYAAFVIHC